MLLHQIEQVIALGRDVPLLARVLDEIVEFGYAGFQVENQFQIFVLSDDRRSLLRLGRGEGPRFFGVALTRDPRAEVLPLHRRKRLIDPGKAQQRGHHIDHADQSADPLPCTLGAGKAQQQRNL